MEWANKIAGIGLRLYDLSPFLYLFFRRRSQSCQMWQTKTGKRYEDGKELETGERQERVYGKMQFDCQ